MRSGALAVAATALLAGAGCGGGDEDEPPPVPVPDGAPVPAETADEALERLRTEVEERYCEDAKEVFHSSRHHILEGGPPARGVCSSEFSFFGDLDAGVAKAYGTAAVVTFPGKRSPAVVLALDGDGRYRYVTGRRGGGGSLGPEADRVAAAAVDALARSDCPAFMKVVDTQGFSRREYCTPAWARRVRRELAGSRAKPVRMGSGEGMAFYALRVDVERYFTVAVERAKSGRVLFAWAALTRGAGGAT